MKQTHLSKFRDEIDSIDNQIVHLIARRLSIAKRVGEWKKKNNLPIVNRKREKEVIENAQHLSAKLKIDPNLTEKIMKLIIEKSRKTQI